MKSSNFFFLLLSVFYLSSIRHAFCQTEYLDKSFGVDGIVKQFGSCLTGVLSENDKIIVSGKNQNEYILYQFNSDGSADSSFQLVKFDRTDPRSISFLQFQNNGKLLAIGGGSSPIDKATFPVMYRFNPNGSQNKSFADNPKFSSHRIVLLQSDDKIIGFGSSKSNDTTVLIRLLSNGQSDYSFKSNSIPGTLIDAVIFKNDEIIMALYDKEKCYFVKLQSNGALDSSYGNLGKAFLPFSYNFFKFTSLLVQKDGKLLLAGNKSDDFIIARFKEDGSIDSSFNQIGLNSIDFDNSIDIPSCAYIQDNQQILIAGYSTWNNGNKRIAMARFNQDGLLDLSFAFKGTFTIDFMKTPDVLPKNYVPNKLLVQNDHKIILVGTSYYQYNSFGEFFILRLNNDINVSSDDKDKNLKEIVFYPNPVYHVGKLEYNLLKEQIISIRLVDLKGEVIMTYIQNVKQSAGRHQQIITLPESLTNGIYFISISAPDNDTTIKIVK